MKAACLITATVALSVSSLAQTWVQWPVAEGGSGHWYGLTKHEHRGWGQAEAEAQTHPNGHLVSINSLAEQKFLEATFLSGTNANNAYWIGCSDFAHEGQWVWSTGEPVTFTYWHEGEPNNVSGSEDGATINQFGQSKLGQWNDMLENWETFLGLVEVHDTRSPVGVEVLPAEHTVPPGGNAEFRSFTYGLGDDIQYRWQFHGEDIPGATNQTLVLSNVLRNQSGEYSVIAVLPGPDLLSQPAKLKVVGAPLLVSQPASRVVSEDGTTDFSVTVGGEGPFTCECLFNGVPIPNATQPAVLAAPTRALSDGLTEGGRHQRGAFSCSRALSWSAAEDRAGRPQRRAAGGQQDAGTQEQVHCRSRNHRRSASSSAIHSAVCWGGNRRGSGIRAPWPRNRAARNTINSCFCSGGNTSAAASISANVLMRAVHRSILLSAKQDVRVDHDAGVRCSLELLPL